jgi:dATP pyrophosphohydrolase
MNAPDAVPWRPKVPESVLVVIHTPALDVLVIERADAPGHWQSVKTSRWRPPVFARWPRRPAS